MFICIALNLQAQKTLADAVPTMLSWVKRFRRADPLPEDAGELGCSKIGDPALQLCIPAVRDIEESIWAPKYGLKGIIDASVQTRLAKPVTKVNTPYLEPTNPPNLCFACRL